MNFAFTEEQQMLRDSVRSFLAAKVPSDKVREIMESESGHDDAIWTEMAQLGWLSMHIPEEYGGAGFSFLELGRRARGNGPSRDPRSLLLLSGARRRRSLARRLGRTEEGIASCHRVGRDDCHAGGCRSFRPVGCRWRATDGQTGR